MNYAKLAFLKAEELESRLKNNEGESIVSKVSVLDIVLKKNTLFHLASLTGERLVGVFVSLKLESVIEDAEISLMVGGKVAATERANGLSVDFMVTVDAASEIELGLRSEYEINIVRADIKATGRARFKQEPALFNACDVGNSFGLAKVLRGQIRVFITNDKKHLDIKKSLLLGFGDNADICGFLIDNEPFYAVAHKDRFDNAFLSVVRLNGDSYQIITSGFLINNVKKVALSYAPMTGVVFGYVQNDEAYAASINSGLMLENIQKIDKSSMINFVKKSNPIIAHLVQSNRNLIRVSENEIKASNILQLKITGEVSNDMSRVPPPISCGLENDSWDTIAAISHSIANGLIKDNDSSHQNPYSIGDTKTITLTNGEQITLEIWGFNHDDKSDGSGKAGITFGMRDLMNVPLRRINPTNTNATGWASSEMRTHTLPNIIFPLLPADLQNVVKSVAKETTAGNESLDIVKTSDVLFLFSEREIRGINQAPLDANIIEGEQYQYWRINRNGNLSANRIKRLNNGTESAAWWWVRSPRVDNLTGFRVFHTDGVGWWGIANQSGGVCFGFCV